MMRYPIEQPGCRQDVDYLDWQGNPQDTPVYVFVKGWTGGGAEMCSHMTAEEVRQDIEKKLGPGKLMDDGTNLWWETAEPAGPLDDVGL